MIEANRRVSLAVIFLSVIVAAIICFFVYQQFFSAVGKKENVDFSRTGNLVLNNPGLESGVWYLIYESPGSPANSVKLSFEEESVCGNQGDSCLDLIVGERVLIKGIRTENTVLVREMKFFDGSGLRGLVAE